MNKNITVISSQKNWMEQTALDQLEQVASLPGVTRAVGLPDLHPGKIPVGACFITEGIIYPHIIGNDIGCGMSFYMTDIEKRKMKPAQWIKKLEALKGLQEIDISDMTDDPYMGTIGGGNHFAELQEIHEVYDSEAFNSLNLLKSRIMLLVHSGSRGLGTMILDHYIRSCEAQRGLQVGGVSAQAYLDEHDVAVEWARQNRDMVAFRLLTATGIGTKTCKVVDSVHNNITSSAENGKTFYIHRKGAAAADAGPVVIPGSRGALTYLVLPAPDTSFAGYSIAHGAGRKWSRSLCKARLEDKYTKETIQYSKYKSRVLCRDSSLLYEEAPEAYKNIDTIVHDLSDAGLINVVAAYKPILTYKA